MSISKFAAASTLAGVPLLLALLINMLMGTACTMSRKNGDALEREIRSSLPMGVPLSAVEDFLRKRGIEFSFEPSSKSVHAVARNMKGGTALVSQSLQIQFCFDEELKLKSIDLKTLYTGT